MANPFFQFKQFTIFHDKCAMKVGIDGVLLGAWANIEKATNILDIGSGSGLISLMLAQRSEACIEAIDIDPDAVLQSTENASNSPWESRINTHHVSIQEYVVNTTNRFDLIVSNPPYFIDSLQNPSIQRAAARHTATLTHEELILCAKRVLIPNGRISIILPVNEGEKIIAFAHQNGLKCSRKTTVYPKPNVPAKRLLIEFCLEAENVSTISSELTIETLERHHYTEIFSELVRDFYLKL